MKNTLLKIGVGLAVVAGSMFVGTTKANATPPCPNKNNNITAPPDNCSTSVGVGAAGYDCVYFVTPLVPVKTCVNYDGKCPNHVYMVSETQYICSCSSHVMGQTPTATITYLGSTYKSTGGPLANC